MGDHRRFLRTFWETHPPQPPSQRGAGCLGFGGKAGENAFP